jgi:hypothetical protein
MVQLGRLLRKACLHEVGDEELLRAISVLDVQGENARTGK